MRMRRKKFKHTTHCNAQAANTRFPAALCGLNSDAIESASLRHASSVPEPPSLACCECEHHLSVAICSRRSRRGA